MADGNLVRRRCGHCFAEARFRPAYAGRRRANTYRWCE